MRYRIAVFLLLRAAAWAQEPQALTLRTKIELPHVNGRIDHLTADLKGQRLFVAALGNQTVEVLDIQAGKHLRSLTGLAEPQGLFYDPSTNRLFAACAKDGAGQDLRWQHPPTRGHGEVFQRCRQCSL